MALLKPLRSPFQSSISFVIFLAEVLARREFRKLRATQSCFSPQITTEVECHVAAVNRAEIEDFEVYCEHAVRNACGTLTSKSLIAARFDDRNLPETQFSLPI